MYVHIVEACIKFLNTSEKPNKSLDQSCHNLPEAEQELRKKARTTYPVIVAHGQDNAISVLYNSSVQPLLERYAKTFFSFNQSFEDTPFSLTRKYWEYKC